MQGWLKGQEQIEAMKTDKQIWTRKRSKTSAVTGSDVAKRRAFHPELETEMLTRG